eukprot:117520-Alexandrium_andersonii.AAC.1
MCIRDSCGAAPTFAVSGRQRGLFGLLGVLGPGPPNQLTLARGSSERAVVPTHQACKQVPSGLTLPEVAQG